MTAPHDPFYRGHHFRQSHSEDQMGLYNSMDPVGIWLMDETVGTAREEWASRRIVPVRPVWQSDRTAALRIENTLIEGVRSVNAVIIRGGSL